MRSSETPGSRSTATVTVLVQIAKRALPGEGYGVYLAGLFSLLATLLWVVSADGYPPGRVEVWSIFAGFVTVFSTAAGIYSVATMPTASPPRRLFTHGYIAADEESAVEAPPTSPADGPAFLRRARPPQEEM